MARQTRKKSGTGIYQVLRYALSFGAGVRQLSRLTGISFGVVQKLKNDHQIATPHSRRENRPHDSNHQSVGIAHEFAHVILFLRGLPHSHSQNGGFIYNRQFNVMKRLGYDYVDR